MKDGDAASPAILFQKKIWIDRNRALCQNLRRKHGISLFSCPSFFLIIRKKGGRAMLDQIMLYVRENTMVTAMAAGVSILFLLLLVLLQVTRTRREVHKICKRIRKYFDVVFTEEEPVAEPVKETAQEVQIPVYKTQEELQKEQEEQKKAEDARLLMEVISEVF
jgi:hypothetical protein